MSSDLSRYAPAWVKTLWAKVLGGALAAMLILAVVGPYLLDVDRYRGRISDLISLQTGRKVTLGKIHATILPRLGFSVDGFQMANPPDFVQGQIVRAEQIQGALAFWPLVLRRELRVVSLELVEPRLTLLEDDRGRNNYTFPPRRPAAAPSPKQTQTGSASSTSLTLMIDQVTMQDAAVFYGTVDHRGRLAATMHISNLDVELRQIALQPLRFREWQADAQLGGTQLTLAGWTAPILFDSGSVELRDGKLDSSFTVQFGKAARVEGAVTVPDVEDAVPQFDVKTDDLDLDALLAGTAEPFPAPGRNVNLGALPAQGGRPRALGATRSAAVPANAPTPTAVPRRMVAQGHIAAEHIRQGNYTAGPLTADLRVFDDRAEIWPFTLRLAGGTMQLTARTDRRQIPQRFSANVQVRDLNTQRILQDSPALKGKLSGAAELDMQLIGSLETRWTESLTGSGQFVIRNGRVAHLNLTGATQSLASLTGFNGDTPFTRIGGDLSIHDQRITSRQIHMDSPRGTLDLKGSCGFYGSLEYEGQMIAQLSGASKQASEGGSGDIPSGVFGSAFARNMGAAQITVPFILRGTLQQPQLGPGRTSPKFTRTALHNQPAPAAQPQQTNSFSFPSLFGR
jgi:hypothetical protein